MNLVKKATAFQKVQRLFLEEVKSGTKCLRRKKSKSKRRASCNSKVTQRRIRRRSARNSDQKKSRKVNKRAENYV